MSSIWERLMYVIGYRKETDGERNDRQMQQKLEAQSRQARKQRAQAEELQERVEAAHRELTAALPKYGERGRRQ